MGAVLPGFKPQREKATGSVDIVDWRPEDPAFWESEGKRIAYRNLWISVPALLCGFAVWGMWGIITVQMLNLGFPFTQAELFTLTAIAGISGATMRIPASFLIRLAGGRNTIFLTTAMLLSPALGTGIVLQHKDWPLWAFQLMALWCGVGGGNFASSMSNISTFFPKRLQGTALGLNAGVGNLGVGLAQLIAPLSMYGGALLILGGNAQTRVDHGATMLIWVQNAGFIWVPFIAASAFAAWFGMNDIASAKASFSEQAVIFQRKHNWLMCWLYTGTFGSFIGYSAGFPLLAKTQFPAVDALPFVFLGPLVGALSRSATGWVSDRWGGGRVTLGVFVLMMAGVAGVLYFLGIKDQPNAFWGFFAMFLLLFFATGVGNASTFQMIPNIMRKEIARLMPKLEKDEQLRQAEKESAAITGFTSAIAAFGAFFIPKSFGSSIALTGGVEFALWGFLVFYVSCLVITWWFYTRPGGLLYDVERRSTSRRMASAAAPAE